MREFDAISERLVAARASGKALNEFPGTLPETLEDAYAVQSTSITRWPDEIAGWKVGMVPESFRPQLAAERLTGPIFQSSVVDVEPGSTSTMPIFSGGFAAVEAEFVIRVGTTIQPADRHYSDDELAELIAAVHVGAEIASSPLAAINKLGPCCVVSDFGNNAGLLVGPHIPGWNSVPASELTAAVSLGGEVVGSADATAIEGGLLQVLRYLLEICARRGLEIAEGTLVSSGALTGIHEVTVGTVASVDFGAFGSFTVEFEAMQPMQQSGRQAED